MPRRFVFAVLCWASLVGHPALASDTVLPPSGKWVINYDGDRCVLARQFGSGLNRATIKFIRYAPDIPFELEISGEPFSGSSSQSTLRLRFGEAGPLPTKDAIIGRLGGVPTILTGGSLDNIEGQAKRVALTPEQEAAVTTLHVVLGLRHLVLTLGPMDEPMAALRACEAALVKNWGLDPQEQATLSAPPEPVGSPGAWITSSDYPTKPLWLSQQAIVRFRLMIDAQGVPTSCAVQANVSRDPSFAATTCRTLMQRARFKPARSATGQPVPSYFSSRVRWLN